MKYLALVYLSRENLHACPDKVCWAYAKELVDTGRHIAAEALSPTDTAVSLQVRNGKMTTIDGPFAETKEQLAGFYLIDAKDMNDAISVASRIPPIQYGTIEVRPVRELDLAN